MAICGGVKPIKKTLGFRQPSSNHRFHPHLSLRTRPYRPHPFYNETRLSRASAGLRRKNLPLSLNKVFLKSYKYGYPDTRSMLRGEYPEYATYWASEDKKPLVKGMWGYRTEAQKRQDREKEEMERKPVVIILWAEGCSGYCVEDDEG